MYLRQLVLKQFYGRQDLSKVTLLHVLGRDIIHIMEGFHFLIARLWANCDQLWTQLCLAVCNIWINFSLAKRIGPCWYFAQVQDPDAHSAPNLNESCDNEVPLSTQVWKTVVSKLVSMKHVLTLPYISVIVVVFCILQASFATCCGQTQIRTQMAGVKMIEAFHSHLELMWSASS